MFISVNKGFFIILPTVSTAQLKDDYCELCRAGTGSELGRAEVVALLMRRGVISMRVTNACTLECSVDWQIA